MKEETALHVRKAQQLAVLAHRLLRHTFVNDTTRDAYLAAYHAAQAYIIEHTGQPAGTHNAVHARFAELAEREPRIGDGMKTFLATTYPLKTAVDYDAACTGELSPAHAQNAVLGSEAFVKLIASLLTHPPNPERERSGAPLR